jgi:SAM-dependent methyltransferase
MGVHGTIHGTLIPLCLPECRVDSALSLGDRNANALEAMMRRLAIFVVEYLNLIMRKLTSATHFLQYGLQWGWEPRPEWFDHYLDQHWQMSATNNGLWVERGVFSRMMIKPGGRMLEICCGDGYNAKHFYSSAAASITAIDFDKDAIPHAKRFNSAPNVTYLQRDIRHGLPEGRFDNIVWDAAIEHFTEAEIDNLLKNLVGLLGEHGVLSGYTLTEARDGRKSNALHEYEFKDMDDLRRFFTPHFKHVRVWETIYPTRHILYFAASQSPISALPA